MAGAADFEEDYWLHADSNSDDSIAEIPSLDLNDDVEESSSISKEPIFSPTKSSSHLLNPEQDTAEVEGDRAGEGGRDIAIPREQGY